MVGKSHRPSLLERIIGDAKAGTTRRAGGLASNAASTADRVRIAASRRGASSGLSPQATKSQIDIFDTITGTGTSTFTLTYVPKFESWNVSLNGITQLDDDADDTIAGDYTISGRTLTVLDPEDLFGNASAEFPCTLQVQYDYLTGVPTAPLVQVMTLEGTDGVLSLPSGANDGDYLVVFLVHDATLSIAANDFTLLGATASVSNLGLTYKMSIYGAVNTGADAFPSFTAIGNRDTIWAVLAIPDATGVDSIDLDTASGATGTTPAPPSGETADLRIWAIISTSESIDPDTGTVYIEHTGGASINYGVVRNAPNGPVSASLVPAGTAGWMLATISLAS